jgi:Na+/phosphate symporter
MKPEVKDLLQKFNEMGGVAENCVSLLQTAFLYNKPQPITECRAAITAQNRTAEDLTKKITDLARENTDLKPYVSVPIHLLRIGENIDKLTDFIERKVRDKILFSDRAATEVTFLLQRLTDILRPTSDLILARNSILSKYVQESEAGVQRRATEYTTQHEERLIEGICAPAVSSLYINILDRIKGIAWHAKEIASKIA